MKSLRTLTAKASESRYLKPSDTRPVQIRNPDNTNRYLRISADHSGTIQCRYRSAQLQFRSLGNTNSTNVVVFRLPNSSSDDAILGNGVGAAAFNSSSDARLKVNIVEATVGQATNILDNVKKKRYSRKDRNNQARVDLVAQDLQTVRRSAKQGANIYFVQIDIDEQSGPHETIEG